MLKGGSFWLRVSGSPANASGNEIWSRVSVKCKPPKAEVTVVQTHVTKQFQGNSSNDPLNSMTNDTKTGKSEELAHVLGLPNDWQQDSPF